MASESLLDAALACAGRGWPVLPLHGAPAGRCTCGRADCPSPGKHPRTRRGFKDASVDVEVIRRWWARWPSANVGVRTGAVSGLLVLDVDAGGGRDGPRELADLEARHGPLPETPQVMTGGGGMHHFFRHPGGWVASTPHALGPALDLRADDAYVVAPPSVHASGRPYAWEVEHHPDDVPLADAPAWLLNGAGAKRPPAAAPTEAADPRAEAAAVKIGRFVLRPDAEPPSLKLQAALANDPRMFRRSWERRRADLQDQSASSYDLSLASLCARAGWSDQEVANTLIAWRRNHGEDVSKALRVDYMTRTLTTARAGLRAEADVHDAADALAAAAQEPEGVVDDGRRAVLLAAASKALGIEIAGFEQLGQDPKTATFTLVFAGGRRVPLGSAVDVLMQSRVRAAIYAEAGRAVRALKPAAWMDLCNGLGRIRRLVENPAGERVNETREWLLCYFSYVHVHEEAAAKANALPTNNPFVEGGQLHVHADHFSRFVKMDLAVAGIDRAEVWARLREIGFAPRHVAARLLDAVVTRYYWIGGDLRPSAGQPRLPFSGSVYAREIVARPEGEKGSEDNENVKTPPEMAGGSDLGGENGMKTGENTGRCGTPADSAAPPRGEKPPPVSSAPACTQRPGAATGPSLPIGGNQGGHG